MSSCSVCGITKRAASWRPFQLPLLGSNQDSPDPESGVLPVTPRGSTALNCHGAEGDRTPDLCSAIAALSQLSYSPWGSFPRGRKASPGDRFRQRSLSARQNGAWGPRVTLSGAKGAYPEACPLRSAQGDSDPHPAAHPRPATRVPTPPREARKRSRAAPAFPQSDTGPSRSAGAGSAVPPVSPGRKTAGPAERAWGPGRS